MKPLSDMNAMHIKDLDLNLLRLFNEVYRAGSVSRAAEHLARGARRVLVTNGGADSADGGPDGVIAAAPGLHRALVERLGHGG